MPDTIFSTLMDNVQNATGETQFHVPDDWMQGRTAYGGLVAAMALTWALGFVHLDRMTCSEKEWWAYHCVIDSAERGYTHERSTLWDPEGKLAVFSQQTTTIFA